MEVQVIKRAAILIPNKEHENFTETEKFINVGTILKGQPTVIKGKRRGQDFQYNLFVTDDKKIIHINKIKPMKTTEIALGADSATSATVVDIKSGKKLLTRNVVIATLVGAGAGYYYSAKMKGLDKKKVMLYSLGGAIVGFLTGKYLEKRNGITFKPSK
jgi:hypothetical protein